MKLDYLQEGSDDCPLIRLYEFKSAEIQRLRASFDGLASGAIDHASLADIVTVETVDGTNIQFTCSKQDRGVVPAGAQQFNVMLTQAGWHHCSGLLEPLCEPSWGYEWLCDHVGRIRILVSHDGSW